MSQQFDLLESVARVAALRGQIRSALPICRAQQKLGEKDLQYHVKIWQDSREDRNIIPPIRWRKQLVLI